MDISNMSKKEYQNTIELFDGINDMDLDAIITHLQFIRAKRKRDFEAVRMSGFCDACMRSYPATYVECYQCGKPLRILPIRVNYSYLLDGDPKDGNIHFKEI
jgi:rRNA maturation endonuclease Nob1